MTTKTRPCYLSNETVIGTDVHLMKHGDPVVCPNCNRALKVFRRWGQGAVARYPRHNPASKN